VDRGVFLRHRPAHVLIAHYVDLFLELLAFDVRSQAD
jgi:hypothetical protein